MIEPPSNDRRPPISPQLALRIAILGGVALVLFAIVFFRLWYLQVLSGDSYRAEANQNRVRDVRVQAPRGEIKDRNGRTLVENRTAIVVELEPQSLPAFEADRANVFGQQAGKLAARRQKLTDTARQARRDARHAAHKAERSAARARARAARAQLRELPRHVAVPPIPTGTAQGRALEERFRRLGSVLHMSVPKIQAIVMRGLYTQPYANVRLKTDVSRAVYGYMLERPEAFPGIDTQPVIIREYPKKELAAQLFGTVGQISPQELEDKKHYRGVTQGTIVGQSGLERSYDKYLRGRDGAKRISVDASGNAAGRLSSIPSKPGENLRLSLDLGLQQAGQQALQHAMSLAGSPGGAFVAMDPRNGDIYALGSLPSFDPNLLTKGLTQSEYDQKLGPAAGSPQVNRATQSSYPTGSTFKPITAMAAMMAGVIGPYDTIDDTGSFDEGAIHRQNAGGAAYGVIAMAQAIKVSSDVFFYTLGKRLYYKQGLPLQHWAHLLGLGRYTGIDIPGENKGVIPGPAWRERQAKRELACRKKLHVPSCGLSDGDPNWREGDEVNTAVGQGDVQATPLQLAVAYSALANGGRIVSPHVGQDVEDYAGRVIQQIERGSTRHVKLDPTYRNVILQGLHAATSEPGGTSQQVFANWPQAKYPVYGKTGTAQTGLNRKDQAWYVCFVEGPQVQHPIVVAVTVEHSGFGASFAAPVAQQILAHWYGVKGAKFVQGSSRDN